MIITIINIRVINTFKGNNDDDGVDDAYNTSLVIHLAIVVPVVKMIVITIL